MQKILDFKSFLNEGYMNEADITKGLMVRIGNEIGKDDTKNNVLYMDLSDTDINISKLSDKVNKAAKVIFGSSSMEKDDQKITAKTMKIPPVEDQTKEANLAKDPTEAKQKAYSILGSILAADQVGESTFKFQPEKAKMILKELFMLRKNPQAMRMIKNNPLFDGFLKGLAINSNEAGTIASSLGEYKSAIDPKKMQEIFRSAAMEANK